MTTPERYERLRRLFEAACELEPSQRSALLDRECADDPELRREVEALMAEDSTPSSFLEGPALSEDLRLTDVDKFLAAGADDYKSGHRIDNYVIREPLGEGGVAVVYLAEQEEPVRRRVALKIVKPGMDSRQVIARFEAERQALAMMDHACVAKVFDAGSTEAGRPYFVMEHVPGISITEHCDRQRLSIEDRLKLFMQVCEAVQHAHQKGIIHRDLKPGNVLVLVKDGQAVPKVIDFGVAKALHQRLTERTIFTEQGQFIGTPAYMSPEQAELTAQDIDTRSDIYSLGVLLYELLTGAPPFDPKTLRQAAYGEIQRIIREEDPPKPSTRLSTIGDESTVHAQECRSDPRSLVRELRGDLDWIVMKALEKDRTRRYETASELAMDIRRHLGHEPVNAGPPSRAYRLRKFVRRNRTGVAAGTVVAISLIAATVVSVGFALGEAEQRRVAARERDIAQAVNEFLNNDLLAAVAPTTWGGLGRNALMRDVLDVAAKRIEEAAGEGGRFEDKPLVEAAIRMTLGDTYVGLGEFDAAEPHLKRAWELRLHELGEEDPETVHYMVVLASLYQRQARFDEAEPLLLQGLEIRRRVAGEEHEATAHAWRNLSKLYRSQGRLAEAAPLLRQALEIRERVLGEEHEDTAGAMHELAVLYGQMGRADEAEALYLRALEIRRRVLGEEHPVTLSGMTDLATFYRNRGRLDEAERRYLELLEIEKRTLGDENPVTLVNLGITYAMQGRVDEAVTPHLQALEIMQRVYGPEHPQTLSFMHHLANTYVHAGRYDEAEALWLQAIEVGERVLGEEHPQRLEFMGELASMYVWQGRNDEAELALLELFDLNKRIQGNDHPETLRCMVNLARAYQKQGKFDEAESLFLEVIEINKRVRGKEHLETLRCMVDLAIAYRVQGKYEEAEPLYLEALEIGQRVRGAEHPETLWWMLNLAVTYRSQGKYDEAMPLYLEALEIKQRVMGPEHPETLNLMSNIAIMYMWQGRHSEAESLLLQTTEAKERNLGKEHPETLSDMALLHEARGRFDLALEMRRKLAERPEASFDDLNLYAWMLLTAEPESLRDPEEALKCALRANEMSSYQWPKYLDTLALAYHLTGDTAAAIETQKKALLLLPAEEGDRAEYEARLAEFEASLMKETTEQSEESASQTDGAV